MWINNHIQDLMWWKKKRKEDYNWITKLSPCVPRLTKDYQLPVHFPPPASVPCKFKRRRTTDVPYCTFNWPYWKIQQEIMRRDMSKHCRGWKAWRYHECFKKVQCSLQIGWGLFSWQPYKIQFIWLLPAPVPYWEADPDLTKDKQSYTILFTPCI